MPANEKIKKIESVPSELMMKLEQIRMFLSQGKASVMVGAGFSKNAYQSEFATMKDWPELTRAFYNQLFIDETERDRNISLLHEPLKLAQMYECSFGRNALDALIQSSLPNEAAAPGKMHEKLMQLNWRDVFTTNYDTLLERAAVNVGKIYHEVTNKETLLYTETPRIIKLHGSFPNIRPYIITEEDFRTYPQQFPEFVNTVRQALMESLFCLLGFSGNDPNFLQWIGWLRDVMGNQMSPVYLITYEPNLHKSQVDLFKRRGIEIVNIASLGKDVSFSQGLEFVLDYISKEPNDGWSLYLDEKKIEEVKDVLDITNKMKAIREKYPPYLYLPGRFYRGISDFMPYKYIPDEDVYTELSLTQKIQYLREIVWRYEVTLTPIYLQWLLEKMQEIAKGDEKKISSDMSAVIDIQLALLRTYRESGDDASFNEIACLIKEKELKSYQRHRLYYELCIQSLSLLNYKEVRRLLQHWEVDGTEIKYALWKASVLSEIGEDGDAMQLLTHANQRFRQSLLTQSSNQHVIETYSSALDEIIELHKNKKSIDTPLIKQKQKLIQAIKEAESKSPFLYESKHNFGIDSLQNKWNSGTNLVDRFLPAYRYVRLIESTGYPLKPQSQMDEKWLEKSTAQIMEVQPTLAFHLLVRSGSKNASIGCLSREMLRKLPIDWADELYTLYKDKIDGLLKSQVLTSLDKKVDEVLMPAFVRLSTRLDIGNADDFAEQYMEYYNGGFTHYETAQFAIVSENLFARSRTRHNYRMFSANKEELHHYLPWSDQWINVTPVFDSEVEAMIKALKAVNEQDAMRTFMRLWYMLSANLSQKHRKQLEDAVRQWRNQEHGKNCTIQILDTFRKVKYKEDVETKSAKYYLNEIVENIVATPVENVVSTLELMSLRTNYNALEYYTTELTKEQHEQVITKFVELLIKNEEHFKIDDSATLFGGFRNDVQLLVVQFTKYFAYLDLQNIESTLLNNLMDVCERYNDYQLAMVAILTKLNNLLHHYTNAVIGEKISVSLAKGTYYEYAEGLQAVRLVENTPLRNKLVESMVYYVEYCQDRKAQAFLYTLMNLINDKVLQKSGWQQKIGEMLNRIADAVVDFNGSEEERMDIMYYANMLAGAVHVRWGDNNGVKRWKEISLSRSNFNDVRAGFDIGQSMAYGDKKMPIKKLLLDE